MSAIETLGEFVSTVDANRLLPSTVEAVSTHTLDTVGAVIAGAGTADGAAITEFAVALEPRGEVPILGSGLKGSLLSAVMASCASTRCTEIDDIHLGSCTTPGSVVVPTALTLVAAGHLPEAGDLIAAVVAGYDVLIRVGLAIDGPRALYRGVWPTYAAAACGSAAVAARALGLDGGRTAQGLAMAFALVAGTSSRVKATPSSRWLTLGVAAQNGVLAALAAQRGFAGEEGLLDKGAGPLHGLFVARDRLAEGLGESFLVEDTAFKPYPTARQALAAVEAFRELLGEGVDPDTIEGIDVRVPGVFAAMIDQPRSPTSRLDSLLSVQYQMALAAYHPEALLDVGRSRLPADERLEKFMGKIRVVASPELERVYPGAWPARVDLRLPSGSLSRDALHLAWDPGGGAGWSEIEAKFRRVTAPALSEERATRVVEAARGLASSEGTRAFLENLL